MAIGALPPTKHILLTLQQIRDAGGPAGWVGGAEAAEGSASV